MALEVLLAQTMEPLGLLQPHRVLIFQSENLAELELSYLQRPGLVEKALTEHPPHCMDAAAMEAVVEAAEGPLATITLRSEIMHLSK